MQTITEGAAEILIPRLDHIPSKDMPVFYNPVMKHNRDVAVAAVHAFALTHDKPIALGLPLEGTGIRAIRFRKEIPSQLIGEIHINDLDPAAAQSIRQNLEHNKVNAEVFQKEATQFLIDSKGYHYIDIDPFGTPAPFLDASIKRIARNGMLAITATDTAALCGTYPETCRRRYDAIPLRTAMMHEVGLRILIRKIQTIGAMHDKAFIPVLSYAKQHYFRTYGMIKKNVVACDKIVAQTGWLKYCDCQWHATSQDNTPGSCPHCSKPYAVAGPMYLGSLNDASFVDKALSFIPKDTFLSILHEELDRVGFYYIPWLAQRAGAKQAASLAKILERVRKEGYHATRTHFDLQGIKTDMPIEKLLKCIGR